ncbi:LuxR family two component transcriptional regulator [Humibacillus xanthopallidus]|uniref:LuxR family two component transcriptional regulator n=1 Tax=Humibacillus xanthopallidus TaxID=412689 RepID=A0A543PWM2_9MICO|nr:response regulator transcription factor [Humibacillus xanthopallidus]TQN48481.1 LuxR family two component transcriptional regulator [Humibacillus xanthopallidus]
MRVTIVEDQLLTREGIVRTLSTAGIEVVAAVGDLIGLERSLTLDAPDAVVLDVRLPPTFTGEGIEAAEQMRRRQPPMAVLVLSQYVEAEFATRLVTEFGGGIGYLLKDRLLDPATLVDGLRRVTRGDCVIDPSLVAELLARRESHGVLDDLTGREVEVLRGIGEGLTNAAIAQRLFISDRTVEVHAQHVFAKLGIRDDPDVNRRVSAAIAYLSAVAGPR